MRNECLKRADVEASHAPVRRVDDLAVAVDCPAGLRIGAAGVDVGTCFAPPNVIVDAYTFRGVSCADIATEDYVKVRLAAARLSYEGFSAPRQAS
jgi:hypothetical protein